MENSLAFEEAMLVIHCDADAVKEYAENLQRALGEGTTVNATIPGVRLGMRNTRAVASISLSFTVGVASSLLASAIWAARPASCKDAVSVTVGDIQIKSISVDLVPEIAKALEIRLTQERKVTRKIPRSKSK